MYEVALYPRIAEGSLLEALVDTPVVLIHGPRQCGKTTLARMVGEARGFTYFSFDDDLFLAATRSDPIGFLADMPEHVILDEVQRGEKGDRFIFPLFSNPSVGCSVLKWNR